ncbi:MAG: LLM class flavin-dependent oxidoreductase [Betaproteobacteria bacterium]|nr:LLM class flavin-dependent oxidoreductase [Betaproteobacteria bacterium]
MKVFLFHLMPYADLDLAYTEKHNSAWVTLPNTYFDVAKGTALYNRYLDELEFADELSFDGVVVNEHHQNAYGLMPSPVVIAAALSRRTSKVKIAILGNAFCLREHPLTLAEEHAMLDHLTGGRIITGMVRGIGAEYFSMAVSPAVSHERYHEAHDLVIQAWTRPGPFEFEGKHYHFRYVNLWPKPVQQPHPPIWVPSQGSRETVEWAADRRYVYLQSFSPVPAAKRYFDLYREMAEQKFGYTAERSQFGWTVFVYVAQTDEIALRESKPHIENFFEKFLKMPMEMMFPPGYLTQASYKGMIAAKGGNFQKRTAESLMETGMFVCGSPKTVREILTRRYHELGFEYMLPMLQFATLPADQTRRSMELFGREVLPQLQQLDTPYKASVAA